MCANSYCSISCQTWWLNNVWKLCIYPFCSHHVFTKYKKNNHNNLQRRQENFRMTKAAQTSSYSWRLVHILIYFCYMIVAEHINGHGGWLCSGRVSEVCIVFWWFFFPLRCENLLLLMYTVAGSNKPELVFSEGGRSRLHSWQYLSTRDGAVGGKLLPQSVVIYAVVQVLHVEIHSLESVRVRNAEFHASEPFCKSKWST